MPAAWALSPPEVIMPAKPLLTSALLEFARNRIGDVTEDTGLNYIVALGEVMYIFTRACRTPGSSASSAEKFWELDPACVDKLRIFFHVTVGSRIDNEEMGYRGLPIHHPAGGRSRRAFVLECAKYLGEHAAAAAKVKKHTAILEADLDEAARQMIEEMGPGCPMPKGLTLGLSRKELEVRSLAPEVIEAYDLSSACASLAAAMGQVLAQEDSLVYA